MLFGEFENSRMWKYLIQTGEAILLPCGEISSIGLKLLAFLVCVTIKCLLSIVLYVPVYTLVHWRQQREIKYWKHWDFPHCPVVRTPWFYCRGLGSIPGWGSKKDPRAVQCGKKKKKKILNGKNTQKNYTRKILMTWISTMAMPKNVQTTAQLHSFHMIAK